MFQPISSEPLSSVGMLCLPPVPSSTRSLFDGLPVRRAPGPRGPIHPRGAYINSIIMSSALRTNMKQIRIQDYQPVTRRPSRLWRTQTDSLP